MKVVGFAGFSGAGKTMLVESLIPLLRLQGQRVSVIKHAHHSFDIDHPGKDSWRHRQAGASEVLLASSQRLALLREYEQTAEPEMGQLIAQLDARVDWVLVEGFKDSDLPKVEVWRPQTGKPVRYPEDAQVVAIATDSPAALPVPPRCPVLDLNQPAAIAAWLLAQSHRFEYSLESSA